MIECHLSWLNNISSYIFLHLCIHTPCYLSIHLLIDTEDFFHIFVIINNAAMNIGCIYFFQISTLIFFMYIPIGRTAGSYASSDIISGGLGGVSWWLSSKESACSMRHRFDPWVGRSTGGGNCNSFHFPDTSVGKDSSCNAGDPGLIPGSGRSHGEGIGYPLQYSWASCGII